MRFDGLLVLDKPAGITSRDAVNRVQSWFPRRTRIGHTGTLDPLATGVLVVCVGSATRLAEYVQDLPKTYRAGVVLGATSDTDDADGTITPSANALMPTRFQIEQALTGFLGSIEQVPPAYSAAKVGGRRAYALARQGRDFDLQARTVTIHAITLLGYEPPRLEIEVACGKGTYIRSLARDLGARLGCGGYIASLRRTRVGSFHAADALALDTARGTARERLLPVWRAVQEHTPIALSDEQVQQLRYGQRITFQGEAHPVQAVVDQQGQMVAVVAAAEGGLRPLKVFGVQRESDPSG